MAATTSSTKPSSPKQQQAEEDEEDTFGDLIGCQPLLRHQHHQRYITHRNSLHIPTSPLTLSSNISNSGSASATAGRQLLGIPEKYDRKLRRLSDPGGGILLKGDVESKLRSPSGKLCDPRLEAIRSLSPSKASQAAGEEGEALTPPPPVLFACRSSRSKSVFQLPGGMFLSGASAMGGAAGYSTGASGMGVSGAESFGGSGYGKVVGGRNRSTRPDSPTPPTFFDQSTFTKPSKQFYPKPTPIYSPISVASTIFSSTSTTKTSPPLPPPTTSSPQSLSPTAPPSLKLTPPPETEILPSCDELTSPSYHFRRRRSISLEGTKLEAILEENSKSSAATSGGSGRKMSLPDFENQ
ncbi:hypothetical protein HELRODRAFT_190939 [Helobdella robusta]|uniref:Uncharacterized protein n=1 Tax=Helobdella robusta TaxID=6412 RepID=T1FSF9_HELRO|nr:hypothetical protein HELRODRAFT_190939 [Helobdella robusta]ESO08204.1 hypothetical protein HELRODRAFT_190939 [Helobdella robusta]